MKIKNNAKKIKIAEEQGEVSSETMGKEMEMETKREPHEPEQFEANPIPAGGDQTPFQPKGALFQ